jgi:hypothetical protein
MFCRYEHNGLRVYRCPSKQRFGTACGGARIRADDLATAVWATISEALKDENLLTNHIQQLAQNNQQGSQLDEDKKAAKHAIAAKRRRALDLVRNSDPSNTTLWEAIQQEVKTLDQQIKEWEATVKDIEKRQSAQQNTRAQLIAIHQLCRFYQGQIDCFNFQQQRAALEGCRVKARGNGTEIWVQWEPRLPISDRTISGSHVHTHELMPEDQYVETYCATRDDLFDPRRYISSGDML